MHHVPPDDGAVREELARILHSPGFRRADRSSGLLRYIVEQTIAGRGEALKEYTLGVEALGRGVQFDPRTDPIVRAEASRLRERLARYYASSEGADDPIIIELPKGSYVPRFVARPAASAVEPDTRDAEPAGVGIAVTSRSGLGRRFSGMALAGVVLAVAVAIAARSRAGRGPLSTRDTRPMRFDVELRSDGTLGSEVGTDVVISADGMRLVFVARDTAGLTHLYARRLDETVAVRLPGTDGARVPFLSPDGRWVGFWVDGKVKRVAVEGGSPVVLCDATDLLGASWGEDGSIIAALNPTQRLWRIPETGGVPRVVTDLSAANVAPVWPQLLRGGGAVLYSTTARDGAVSSNVEAFDFRTGGRRVLVRGGAYPRVLPNGYLTYVNQGTLYAVRFDTSRLVVQGTAVPILDDVAYSRTFGYAQFDVARNGTLVYRRSAGSGKTIVTMLDRSGESTTILPEPGQYAWPRLSTDGRSLAFASVESDVPELRVGRADGALFARVTRPGIDYFGITWWADDRHLIVGTRTGLMWLDATRPGALHSLTTSASVHVPWSVSPSGRVAYHALDPSTGFDLWTVPVVMTANRLVAGTPEPFLRTPAFEVYPTFSPDGRWIAYGSNETGKSEIYVRRYPGDGRRAVRVSTAGGRVPAWSPDGHELLFQTDDQRLMTTTYRIEADSFVAARPRPWTTRLLADSWVFPSFALTPAADRVLALSPATRPEEQQSPNHVTVVLGFLDEVDRRVRGTPDAR